MNVSRRFTGRVRRPAALAAALCLAGLGGLAGPGAPSAYASGTAQINGSGSTWAYNAVNAWIGEVSAQGLRVTFTSNGSAAGRQDFANKATDFAVSDIGFQGVDPVTKSSDTSNGRGYAYVPLVAGGTSFPYHLVVAGQTVRNLRLSGPTLAGIFTGSITNWDAPQISKDNNGRKFPPTPIVPVVHSEGSGTSYQFSAYLAQEFPSLWSGFAGQSTPTEYWPSSKPGEIAQSGSDQMMNYIASSSGQGTIGYDEYSYAIAKNVPVAKIENTAGYYTLPTQYNVAVALTQAIINYDKKSSDYLLESLKNVYGYKDPRTYPLSSYSYGIIPTASNDPTMSTPKRQTLADFLYTSICQGQGAVGQIGYSALPVNLVEAGFQQVGLLRKADSGVSLKNLNVTTCGNPTFVADHPSENHLAQIAPQPPLCDKQGSGPCTTDNDSTGTAVGSSGPPTTKSGTTKSGTTKSGTTKSGTTKTGTGPGGTGSTSPGDTSSTGTGPGGTGLTGTDPTGTDPTGTDPTGTDPTGAGSGGLTVDPGSGNTGLEPVTLAAGQGSAPALGVLAVLLLLAGLVLPPVLWRRWSLPKSR